MSFSVRNERAKAGDRTAGDFAVKLTAPLSNYFGLHGQDERRRALFETTLEASPSPAHHDFDRVLTLLGPAHGSIPVSASSRTLVVMLRANALEKAAVPTKRSLRCSTSLAIPREIWPSGRMPPP